MNQWFEIVSSTRVENLRAIDAIIVLIDGAKTTSERQLLDQYHAQLQVAYMGTVWDSLDEVLRDCDWMEKDSIYIVHTSIPQLPEGDLKIYFNILQRTAQTHTTGPTAEHQLPQRKIDFHVVFIAQNEDERKEIENKLAAVSSKTPKPVITKITKSSPAKSSTKTPAGITTARVTTWAITAGL